MGQLAVDLKGKTVVVTGAGTGIGRAIALAMARGGASVVVNYCRSKTEAEQVAVDAEQLGGHAVTVQADVTKRPDVESMFQAALSSFGRVDVLVNNAGGSIDKVLISEMDDDTWDRTIELNLKSVFLCSRAAIPLLPDREGRIINITSISGHTGGGITGVAYGAAKGGLITMTRGLAHELAPRGITVNAIAPGIIDTRQHTIWTKPEDYQALIENRVPLKRDGKPDDLVGVTMLLASDQGAYINGEIIHVNGGMLMV